jgi:hypothetical protein
MRILGQRANLKQASGYHTRSHHIPVQFDAGEQAPPAHLANDRIVDRASLRSR